MYEKLLGPLLRGFGVYVAIVAQDLTETEANMMEYLRIQDIMKRAFLIACFEDISAL